MLLEIINHALVFFLTIYLTSKLVNKKVTLLSAIPTCIVSGLIYTFIKHNIDSTYVPFTTLICTLYCLFVFHENFKISIIFSIIANTFMYGIRTISSIITGMINMIIAHFASDLPLLVGGIIVEAIAILIVYLLFKIKRFSKGMSFIRTSSEYTPYGIVIGIASLIFICVSTIYDKSEMLLAIAICFSVSFFLILLFWWQSNLSMLYLQKRCNHDTSLLLTQVDGYKKENSLINSELERLSSIIHNDNKLIPAMINAVNSLSENSSDSQSLLDELNKLAADRKGILNNNSASSSKINLSGEIRTDSILKYIEKRANDTSANFEVEIFDNYANEVSNYIELNDICTLFADLCENALIATKEVNNPSVKLITEKTDDSLTINIYDNAPAFSKKVLNNIGKKRVTTHKKEGGSGIGLMTMCEIVNRYNGTFSIDENIQCTQFTKVFSLKFPIIS